MGKAILMSALVLSLLRNFSFFTLVVALAYLGFLFVIDEGRGIRILPSAIMARFMFGIWAFMFVFCYLFMNVAAGRTFFTLVDTIVVSFWVAMAFTVGFWLFAWIGTHLVASDPDYDRWRKAGGHYFWDLLPRILNPDSDLVRSGGLSEPVTAFVPPNHWNFQCPSCGARVEQVVDICWNCNYGADGNSEAYFERYSRK